MTKEMKEILAQIDEKKKEIAEIRSKTSGSEDEEELKSLLESAEEAKKELEDLTAKREQLESRSAIADGIQSGKVATVSIEKRGNKNMTIEELRNSTKYIDAYAEAIKTGNFEECRAMMEAEGIEERALTSDNALLSSNSATGNNGVLVPTIVENTIRTAFENDPIMGKVFSTEIAGNVEIGFEYSSTGAERVNEGTKATEGKIELGNVKIVAGDTVKWIRVSHNALDLRGSAFLNYLYASLADKIAYEQGCNLLAKIKTAPETATKEKASVSVVESVGLADFINAEAKLSDKATDVVAIMHKSSYAYYKNLAMNANYNVDPFDGLTVIFNNTLTPADGSTPGVYAIVGDLAHGAQANFPAGKDIKFIFDELTDAESGLVKVVGRNTEGAEIVADKHFAIVKKS